MVMESQDDRAQRAVQSVEVGGRLLLALAGHPEPMSLKDLAAAAGLPASRAHPYLVSFSRLGLVEQRADSGRYALGSAALHIGLACLHQWDPLRIAEPVAAALATGTGHAVALAVWGNFGPTVVKFIEARQPLHVAMRPGTVMSLLGTATGQAFAAALPEARLEATLAGPLGELRDAPQPIFKGKLRELRAVTAQVRSHGVARAVGRPVPGVNAFSAPAFSHDGEPVLVVTALDHQDRMESDWDCASAKAVREAAAKISQRLGWRAA